MSSFMENRVVCQVYGGPFFRLLLSYFVASPETGSIDSSKQLEVFNEPRIVNVRTPAKIHKLSFSISSMSSTLNGSPDVLRANSL